MYLLLSVAGHLTIFQTRTRGPWWSTRPANILLLAVCGTQALATAICIFGFLVTPLWWGWAAMVWGYAFAWFLVTDPIKLLTYHVLNATKPAPAPLAIAEPQADATPAVQVTAKSDAPTKGPSMPVPPTDPTPDAGNSVKTLANTTVGELLVAGLSKDPNDAGRVIADGIVQTKARIETAVPALAEAAPKDPK